MKKINPGGEGSAVEAPKPADPITAPAVEEQPSEGGAYIRLPDGTLIREEEA